MIPPRRNTPHWLKTFFADSFVPLGRAWIRYGPVSLGKGTVWRWFGSRAHSFRVRTRAGFLITGNSCDLIQSRLYWFGVWEPNITAWVTQHLKPGDAFADVGANIGYYTLLASRLVGHAGHVVAIEPAAQVHDRLARHLQINRVRNVSLFRVAVGDKRRRAKIFMGPRNNLGASSLLNAGNAGTLAEEVEVWPLSEILPRELLSRISLVKIDVEGAEADALAGLEAALPYLPNRAAILCEINPERLAAVGSSAESLLDRMRRLGFSAYKIKNVYGVSAYLTQEIVQPELLEGAIEHMADVVFMRLRTENR